MSEHRTPEEDTVGGRREPDEAREDAGLEPEGGERAEGAPLKRDGHATERD